MEQDAIQTLVQDDPAANTANELLTDAGGTVYVVGGAVRDLYLGKRPKDIDLMVTGLTGDQIEAALQGHGRIDFTGKAFGVYRFKTNRSEVEIAMPRVEYGNTNTDYNVDPNISVEEDLLRRDFTANAMAVNPNTGEVVDPFGGAKHIQDKTLALANPGGFADDPTRLLRAITSFSKNNLYPDEVTLQAMKDEAHKLESQPPERLQMELDKLLVGENPTGALQLAEDTGLLKQILPEVSATMGFDQMNPHHDLDVGSHLFAVLKAMSELSYDPDLRLAALLHDIGKPDSFWRDETKGDGGGGHFYKKILDDGTQLGEDHEELGAEYVDQLMRRLRYPNDRRERVVDLVRNHMYPYFDNLRGARKFLALVGGDSKMAFDLMLLREADSSGKSTGQMSEYDSQKIDKGRELVQQVIDQQEAVTRQDLAINGKDLLDLGFKPGPDIGVVLNSLLAAVIENPELNNKESLLGIAQGFLAQRQSAWPFKKKRDYDQEWQEWENKHQEKRPEAPNLTRRIRFKWAYTPYDELDVWPVENTGMPDHAARRGIESYYKEAQGWIMDDGEVTVHEGYVSDELTDQGWEAAVDWALAHNISTTSSTDDEQYQAWLKQIHDQETNKAEVTPWDNLNLIDTNDFREVTDAEWDAMTPEEQWAYEDEYFAREEQQQQANPAYKNLIDHLPDYKWSWNGYELDVWPTKDFAAEDHFERTGPMFREFAQGRIYIDPDGYLDLFVWENRGTEKEREKAVQAVEGWMLTNLGRQSDVVTYEGEWVLGAPKDNFAPGAQQQQLPTTDPNEFTFPLQNSPFLDEEDHSKLRSIHDYTDEEWEQAEREGRVYR